MEAFWKSGHQTVDKIANERIKNASRPKAGRL